ncbi:MAG: c-type cytochrome [Gemmatimonadota bacterium]|nr:c-type cytochrome [Gemmatimonadota bacterium]
MMGRFRTFRLSALAAMTGAFAACDATPPPVGMERGEELYETCVPCHGEMGDGNVDIAAPTIAGLPQWYIEQQLLSFQEGWRGDHHEDLPGLRMRPMAVSLTRDGDIESVAEYVASLPANYPESTLDGNAGAGAERYEVCVACHGDDGRGDQSVMSPPIVQMHDWYMLNQMRNFKSGARGAHPDDTWGQTMRVNTVALTEQAMRDVIAYVQTLR